ncbi:MAG: glycoside hydrolase family 43 protein [Acetatifactor sp.]|nr:glycoside hydrolase family 43 protein [Acetatifactor sp.]
MEETVFFHEDATDITFTNDLHVVNIGDPFMLKISENEYYMYCTSAANGYYCWRSEDMVHWTDKKMCFVSKTDSWCADSFWAPEVCEWEGKYYMFYTARNRQGSLKIGLAISDAPDGPFVDYENKPLINPMFAVIDANIFIDDDGSKYLYFVRDCSENIINGIHTSQIYGVQLSDDFTTMLDVPVLLTTPEDNWERQSGNYAWNEGPEMIKHDGKYYLAYSANYYESPAYSLGYAVSDSPLGTFVKAENNPILTSIGLTDVSGPGHHSFVKSPDGTEIWAAYHSHTSVKAPSGNRKVNIGQVVFSEDGKMFINGPLTTAQPLPSGVSTTNISKIFTASINEETDKKLTDELILIHRTGKFATEEELSKSSTITFDEQGNAEVVLTSESEEGNPICGIALYAGDTEFPSSVSVRLKFDDDIYSQEYITGPEEASPIVLSFDALTAKKVTILLSAVQDAESEAPTEPESEISLSEISLFAPIN